MGIAREGHGGIDGIAEVLVEDSIEAQAHMLAQCNADVDLLAFDNQIHLMGIPVSGQCPHSTTDR